MYKTRTKVECQRSYPPVIYLTDTIEVQEHHDAECGQRDEKNVLTLSSSTLKSDIQSDSVMIKRVESIHSDGKKIKSIDPLQPKAKWLPAKNVHHVRRDYTTGPCNVTLTRRSYDDIIPWPLLWHGGDTCYAEAQPTTSLVFDVGPDLAMSLMPSQQGSFPQSEAWFEQRGPSFLQEKLTELDGIALREMVPKLDTGFSLPVFLFELAELRQLFEHAFELLARLPQTLKKLFNRPIKELSRHWLASIFGWLPFASDIRQIFVKTWNLKKLINQFLNGANKKKTYYFKKGLSPLTFADQAWFDEEESVLSFSYGKRFLSGTKAIENIAFKTKRKRVVTNAEYRAAMTFKYTFPSLNKTLLRLLAGLDVYGMNLSISDVWEIIPFSFVIDWFYNVQGLLRTFDKTNIPVRVVIYDFCRSIKFYYGEVLSTKGLDSITIDGIPANDMELPHWTVTPETSSQILLQKSYHRWTGVPSPSALSAPDLRLPRGMQLVSLAALIAQGV